MGKTEWKPGNMLYPLPVVMVSTADENDHYNIITVAWTGTVCTNPAMVSISVRPERYSYDIIKRTGEFVINLTTEQLAYATDYCGVRSGRDVDKFKEMQLTAVKGTKVRAPLIAESPVNIECRVTEMKKLGSHDLFLAEVLTIHVDEAYMDHNGKFHLSDAKPIVYSHGEYFGLGSLMGNFGYSVRKKK
ncbi:MAG: flavin reductase family protein [bacterium]|nr:flavin reductase family protein [bacterium]